MKNRTKNIAIALLLVFITSVQAQTDSKSKALLDALVSVNGGYKKLASKKDIQFNYVYDNFENGKDVSLERHIINGEHSWGEYKHHEVLVLPKEKGTVIQSLVDGNPQITLGDKQYTIKKEVDFTVFLRKVNFYWFTMMYKLQDPGTNYTYLGKETVDGINYDKVSLSYSAKVTNKEKNDDYILYFNPKTHLIDLFYFSLPDFGINKPILKMTLHYEVIDGLYLSTVRKSYGPDKNGVYQLAGEYTISNIKFNNGFKKEDFLLY